MKRNHFLIFPISLLFLLIGFLFYPVRAYGQTATPLPIPKTNLQQFQETVKSARETGEMHRENWVGDPESSVLSDTMNGLTTSVVGEINWEDLEKAVATGNFQNILAGGALGFGSNLIATLLTRPPASGIEYFADLGRNLGIAKPAYAQGQGIGFTQLSNLLPLWKAFRNTAYFFFVIIFIVIGLAIMFRVKLDPKTVISIQNAIPKLVIALILVTFSYAIAGLLIDLIYLIIFLGVLAMGSVPGMGDLAQTQQKFVHLNFGDAMKYIIGGVTVGAGQVIGWGGVLILGLIGAAIGGILLVAAPLGGAIIGGLGAAFVLPILIFSIIALFLVIKLFFKLLVVYINIIVSVIFAPLIILVGAFPGSKTGFGSWITNLFQNIIVFPAVSLALLFGQLLIKQGGSSWTPPVLGASGGALTGLLAIGVLFLVASIPDAIKAAFAGKPFAYGTAIGETIGPVIGPAKYGWGIGKKALETKVAKGYVEPVIGVALGRVFGPSAEREAEERRGAGETPRA